MKATPNSEKLTLTFRNNQWTDQHGRPVCNSDVIKEMRDPALAHWHDGLKYVWPGAYEVNPYRFGDDDITLIPPVASEPQNNEWISVNDALPSNSINVLCWLGDVILMGTYYADNTNPKERWAFFFSDNGRQYDEYWQTLLTHWMPLPKPPIK